MNREPVLYSRHHVLWPRKNYETRIEKRVRNLGSLVIRANAVDHQHLHAMMDPPPMLNHDQLHDLYNFMQEHCTSIHDIEGLEWGMIWADESNAYDLVEHFEEQHDYLSGEYRQSTKIA